MQNETEFEKQQREAREYQERQQEAADWQKRQQELIAGQPQAGQNAQPDQNQHVELQQAQQPNQSPQSPQQIAQDAAQVQQKLDSVQDQSPSYQNIAQSHRKFAEAAKDKAATNNEFVQGEGQPFDLSKAQPQTEKAADAVQHYQAEGEIGGREKRHTTSSMNPISAMAQEAYERRMSYMQRSEQRAEQIAGETDPVQKQRLEMLQKLDNYQYEATTSRSAAGVTGAVGDHEASKRMTEQAKGFEAKRDALAQHLQEFDKRHGFDKAKGQEQGKEQAQQPGQKPEQGKEQGMTAGLDSLAADQSATEKKESAVKVELDTPQNPAADRLHGQVQKNAASPETRREIPEALRARAMEDSQRFEQARAREQGMERSREQERELAR